MKQTGFFDLENKYADLDANDDPLLKLNTIVPWESFLGRLEAVWRKPAKERRSNADRKPLDAVLMFKAIALSSLDNLSDDQVEFLIRGCLTFHAVFGFGVRG